MEELDSTMNDCFKQLVGLCQYCRDNNLIKPLYLLREELFSLVDRYYRIMPMFEEPDQTKPNEHETIQFQNQESPFNKELIINELIENGLIMYDDLSEVISFGEMKSSRITYDEFIEGILSQTIYETKYQKLIRYLFMNTSKVYKDKTAHTKVQNIIKHLKAKGCFSWLNEIKIANEIL